MSRALELALPSSVAHIGEQTHISEAVGGSQLPEREACRPAGECLQTCRAGVRGTGQAFQPGLPLLDCQQEILMQHLNPVPAARLGAMHAELPLLMSVAVIVWQTRPSAAEVACQ